MIGRNRIGDDGRAESSKQGSDDQRRDGRVFAHRLDQVVGSGLEGWVDVHIDIDPLTLDAQDRVADGFASRTYGSR